MYTTGQWVVLCYRQAIFRNLHLHSWLSFNTHCWINVWESVTRWKNASTRLKRRPHNGCIKWNITAAVTGRRAGSPSHWAPPTDPSPCVCAAAVPFESIVSWVFLPFSLPPNMAHSTQPGGNLAPIRHWPERGSPAQHLSIRTPWRPTGITRLIAGNRSQAVPKGNLMLGRGDDASSRWETKEKLESKTVCGKMWGFCKAVGRRGCCSEWMEVELGLRAKLEVCRARGCFVLPLLCIFSVFAHCCQLDGLSVWKNPLKGPIFAADAYIRSTIALSFGLPLYLTAAVNSWRQGHARTQKHANKAHCSSMPEWIQGAEAGGGVGPIQPVAQLYVRKCTANVILVNVRW